MDPDFVFLRPLDAAALADRASQLASLPVRLDDEIGGEREAGARERPNRHPTGKLPDQHRGRDDDDDDALRPWERANQ